MIQQASPCRERLYTISSIRVDMLCRQDAGVYCRFDLLESLLWTKSTPRTRIPEISRSSRRTCQVSRSCGGQEPSQATCHSCTALPSHLRCVHPEEQYPCHRQEYAPDRDRCCASCRRRSPLIQSYSKKFSVSFLVH